MSKRVYQIARELDVENSTLLAELQAMGYDVTSAASSQLPMKLNPQRIKRRRQQKLQLKLRQK